MAAPEYAARLEAERVPPVPRPVPAVIVDLDRVIRVLAQALADDRRGV